MLPPGRLATTMTGGRMAKRFGVNKGASAGKFRGQIQRTKSPNVNRQVMRGGWRL